MRIHFTFWFVIITSVWTGHFIEILTLFVLVIAHEMAHVTAAWSFGWRVGEIELFPFGGVARTDEWGTVPIREELVVALAGPFQHVYFVGMSCLFFYLDIWSETWTNYFIHTNLYMILFNLLPIYPLDGGRVFHALCSYVVPYRLAILLTIILGLGLSCLMLLFTFTLPGLAMFQPLFWIALFLIVSNFIAFRQRHYQFLRFLIKRTSTNLPRRSLHKLRLCSEETLSNTVAKWYKERYHLIEVVDSRGRPLGLIPEEVILSSYFDRTHRSCKLERFVS